MVNKGEKERLAVIEEQMIQNNKEHGELKKVVNNVDSKLDRVLNEKADRSELETKADKTKVHSLYKSHNRVVNRLLAVAGAVFTVLLAIIGFLFKKMLTLVF